MVNQALKKTKEIIPPRRNPVLGGIIAVIKGISGIATEIGYALAIMLVAFFICILVTSL